QMYAREQKNLDEHLDEAFGEVRAAGFEAIEGWLKWCATPGQAAQTGELLMKHGLRLVSMYHGGAYHERAAAEQTVAETLEFAKRARDLGCPMLNVNPDPIGREKTDDELKVQGEFLNRLAQALNGLGMSLVVHFHAPEMRNDAREHRANLANTDPHLVGFCIDFHWVWRGGQDPVRILRETAGRTRSLHIRNSVNGVWSETLGDGDIDYRQVKTALDAIGYRGPLIVELAYEPQTQITRSLVENERLARAYAREVFGV
ncbi:MAG: sugar phosphate isomerase/epimerase, partial [Abditibacteriales bacterium]|nr:sugar phosphate isomerase/epimerase [Abditibacteriales bacterium]